MRFAIAEIAAKISEFLVREVTDQQIIPIYELLLQDKEAEVRSEAIANVPELCKYCTPALITEKIIPIITSHIANDQSQHVRGSLAHSICEIG